MGVFGYGTMKKEKLTKSDKLTYLVIIIYFSTLIVSTIMKIPFWTKNTIAVLLALSVGYIYSK